MKQIFLWAFCILALFLGAIALGMNLNILPSPPQDNFDEGDSIKVAEIVKHLQSPEMYSIEDVYKAQQELSDNTTVDGVFLSMDSNVLHSVAGVLLNRDGVVTKESIVAEYRANDNIYNNLPIETATDKDSINQVYDSGGGSPEDNIISQSVSRRTDTVGGKPRTVITKHIERYE